MGEGKEILKAEHLNVSHPTRVLVKSEKDELEHRHVLGA